MFTKRFNDIIKESISPIIDKNINILAIISLSSALAIPTAPTQGNQDPHRSSHHTLSYSITRGHDLVLEHHESPLLSRLTSPRAAPGSVSHFSPQICRSTTVAMCGGRCFFKKIRKMKIEDLAAMRGQEGAPGEEKRGQEGAPGEEKRGQEGAPGEEKREYMMENVGNERIYEENQNNNSILIIKEEKNEFKKEEHLKEENQHEDLKIVQRDEVSPQHQDGKKKSRNSPQEKKTGSGKKSKNQRQGQSKNSSEKESTTSDIRVDGEVQGHRHGTRQKTGHLKPVNREGDRLLDEMTKGMAHLEVQSSENNRVTFLKRNKETLTIEGSPLVKAKKRDMRPTPIAFRELKESLNAGSITNVNSTKSKRIVQVLSFQTEDHDTKDHQENVRRTLLLSGPKGCLRRPDINEFIEWIDESNVPSVQLTDLLRVHEYSYLNHLQIKCKQLENPDSVSLPSFYAPAGYLDTDTPLTKSSFETAKHYCSAAIYAVDCMLASQLTVDEHQHDGKSFDSSNVLQTPMKSSPKSADNDIYSSMCSKSQTPPINEHHAKPAQSNSPIVMDDTSKRAMFVIGRPPGHHAGPNGCVPSDRYWLRADMASSGFCLLNTVAVAAAYARYNYSILQNSPVPTFQRGHSANSRPIKIAIIDIDVHHGNGTEEIVRNLAPHQTYLPLPSSWAPISQLSYKPWLNESDPEDIFFSSVHLFAEERFYPCSGGDEQSAPNILNIPLTPIGPGPWDMKGRKKASLKQRQIYCEQASKEMKSLVASKLLPALRTFQADVVFISTGLDSHYDDMYHYLTEDDIHWLTAEIIATSLPHTQIISILEGGYSLDPTHQTPTQTNHISSPGEFGDISHDANGIAPTATLTRGAKAQGKFSIKPHDGGLVKGTLAHITALSGR